MSATASGVQFLQQNVEDGPKALGAYKAQNTELIRKMLREQQRECQALHANPLFKEFRTPGSIKLKKFGKGYVVGEEVNAPQQLTDPKGLEYEGQARMFDLIKNTAIKEEKTREGVWASFGAPYVPLGDPKELLKTLPDLNRDKMGSREGQRSLGPRRRAAKQAQQAAATQQSQQQQQSPGRMGRSNGARPTSEQRPHSTGSDSAIGMPPRMYSDGEGEYVSPAEAAIRAATREAEDTLNKHKSVMRFNVNDRTEAQFPIGVLRTADDRTRKAKAAASAYVNRREAEEEAADPRRAYGQPALPRKHLAPIPGLPGRRGAQGSEEGGEASSFFLTQQGGQGAAAGAGQSTQDEERRSMSLEAGSHSTRLEASDGRTFAGIGGSGDGEGTFMPIVESVVPLRGDEGNPVYRWHNDFVAVRQAGRAQLQAALFSRAQGRANARTDPSAAAGMSTTLFGVLNLTQGRMPTHAAGGKVVSPYARLDAYQAAQEAARRNTRQKAVQALDPAEIRILQRFYDQLCALVEAQRMSDPLCLMVVSKVKSLLEAGVYLHRPMLVAIVEHVAAFTHGAGMVRYNAYVLAVLTFITKCVGLEAADLEEVVEQHAVSIVVYGTPVPPSKVTADMVAALGGPSEDSTAATAGPGSKGTISARSGQSRTRSGKPPAPGPGKPSGGGSSGGAAPTGGSPAKGGSGSPTQGAGDGEGAGLIGGEAPEVASAQGGLAPKAIKAQG